MHIDQNTEVDILFLSAKDWEIRVIVLHSLIINQLNNRDRGTIVSAYVLVGPDYQTSIASSSISLLWRRTNAQNVSQDTLYGVQ